MTDVKGETVGTQKGEARKESQSREKGAEC